MKIGIVSEYYYPYVGGIAEHVHNTYLHFTKHGITTKVIIPMLKDLRRSAKSFSSRIPDEDIIHVGKSYPFYNNGGFVRFTSPLGLEKRLKQIFARERFDILHIHSPLVPVLPIVALKVADCPVVGTFHTVFKRALSYRLLRKRFEKLMDKMAARIAVSPYCAEVMRKYFNDEYQVISNGVDTALFNPNVPPINEYRKDSAQTILFLGRFDPHNGLGILLKAFKKVRSKSPNCRLIVVGDGPLYKKHQKSVRSISDAVHFVGAHHELRPQFYRTADIFCQPAVLHGLCIVNLEAMASGLPIIASDLPPFRWQLRENALFFPAGDSDSLAESILRLLESPRLRQELGERARKRALDFSWDIIGGELLDLFRTVVDSGRRTSDTTEMPPDVKTNRGRAGC